MRRPTGRTGHRLLPGPMRMTATTLVVVMMDYMEVKIMSRQLKNWKVKRLEEAYTLATEANRTLTEAKQAVARVRAARGYYNPAGMKGTTGTSSKGKKGHPNGKQGDWRLGTMLHLRTARSWLSEVS